MKCLLILFAYSLLALSPATAQEKLSEPEVIASFIRIWGLLKYYHPNVAGGQKDWDMEFLTRVPQLQHFAGKKELSAFYINWISELGDVPKCRRCKPIPDPQPKPNYDDRWLNDSLIFSDELSRELHYITSNRYSGRPYYFKQEPAGNLSFPNEKAYPDSVYPSAALRLLCLARYWNMIHYFYPYKYKMDRPWNQVLTDMIPIYQYAKDTTAYHLAVLQTVCSLNDTHATFVTSYTNAYFGLKWVPFSFRIIEGKAVAKTMQNEKYCRDNDIQYGDAILAVNGESIEDIIRRQHAFVSASNESVRNIASYYSIFNGNTDSVTIRFDRNGKIATKTIGRYFRNELLVQYQPIGLPDTATILDGNIGYVNMGLLTMHSAAAQLEKLVTTRAIIFDIRNYPQGTFPVVAAFLNASTKPFAKFIIPDINFPGTFKEAGPAVAGGKHNTHYKGKVIILFNENTQSHAEFTAMALQTVPNVVSIGSQTSGADGNVSYVTLPGDLKTLMTGIGVYYPDGRETQRIGLVPDIEVKPTLAGFRAKKDEVLEKAAKQKGQRRTQKEA